MSIPPGSDRPSQSGGRQPDFKQRITLAVEILSRREAALASFDGIRTQYKMLMDAYGELRAAHEQLLADLRGTRAELRVAVRSYAHQLRQQGVPASGVRGALKDVLGEILVPAPAAVSDALARDVLAWVVEEEQGPAG
jgi:hypothetical protein